MGRIQKHLRFQQLTALTMLGFCFWLSLIGARSPILRSIQQGERIPLLIFGVDAADQSQHTDTLLVSLFDVRQYVFSLISIPRDTRLHLPGYLFKRVNEIYGFHKRKTKDSRKAANEVRLGVEHLLSSESSAVRVPNTIQVDYSGFEKMVDLLGGVWVQIDQPMHYDDNAGNLHIHFDVGRHLIKGKEALGYVRFRGPTGDRGRILRQQEFMRSMAKRLANPVVILKFPKIIEAVFGSVQTNLSFWDLVFLVVEARHLRYEDFGFYILPGTPKGPYWQMNREATDALVSQVFHGVDRGGVFLDPIVPLVDQITVDVWNASGKKGTASMITKFLRKNQFDVLDWGTYPTEQKNTRVIDRKGNLNKAKQVAIVLGVESCHSEPNPSSLVDVDVVIGSDYQVPVEGDN